MNFISNQIEELTGPDFKSKDTEEKYKIIKSILKWDKYVPEDYDLNPQESSLENPAISFCQKNCDWTENGWKSLINAEQDILNQYPEYIPSDECIEYLSSIDNILEIGAGTGYWSYIINKHGGNCYPTDISPKTPHEKNSSYPITNLNNEFKNISIWSNIEEAKHTIIPEYPNHDILFCHPEGLQWTEEVLELIEPPQRLILVAGWYPSPNATPFFFKKLIEEWNLEKQMPVYRVNSSHACLYVFNKN